MKEQAHQSERFFPCSSLYQSRDGLLTILTTHRHEHMPQQTAVLETMMTMKHTVYLSILLQTQGGFRVPLGLQKFL